MTNNTNKDHYQYFDPNTKGKDFVCSDIHGCFSDLEDELENIGFDYENDRLFCVGDLADRGPESERCMEFLQKPWFYTVYGNHEDFVILDDRYFHASNGGSWFYSLPPSEQDLIRMAFSDLPVFIQVGEYGIMHAELPVGINDWQEAIDLYPTDKKVRESAAWGRHRIRYGVDDSISGIKELFVGHTIVPKPKRQGNIRYIDTGGFLKHFNGEDGYITIIELNHD